mmetsp:Transcript_22468/g.34354  ORF Transcript_22468/g.34354 Transcript_22468/m.34354 type:complete len:225 (-) Transcript_22468:313-987(-)
MSESITPGVLKTLFLLDFDIDKFINARQALVVHVVAPTLHVSAATLPKASTRPGVLSSAASFASALLRFFMHVVAFSRASSPVGPALKWVPTITSRIASKTSETLAISILFAFPQLRFITAMQAWSRALSDAREIFSDRSSPRKGPPLATNASVFNRLGAVIKYRSLSSVAVRLRTVSTAYSRPSQSALRYSFCSSGVTPPEYSSIVLCTNSNILLLLATATRR